MFMDKFSEHARTVRAQRKIPLYSTNRTAHQINKVLSSAITLAAVLLAR